MKPAQPTPLLSISSADPSPSGVRAVLPVLVFMGYLAFLISGFGAHLGAFQAVPLYFVLAMVLLTLQEVVAPHRSQARFIFSIAASAFALTFVLDVVYAPLGQFSFTRSPWTYLLLNVALLAVYAVLATESTRRATSAQGSQEGYGRLAAAFAGAALLFFVLAFLADLAGANALLRGLGVRPWPPLTQVSLRSLFHLGARSPVDLLQGVDVVLGMICAAVALGFLVVVGALLPAGPQARDTGATKHTVRSLLGDVGHAMNESLSVALTPFVWLIPAFSVAYLANATTSYLNQAAAAHVGALQLFNPLSPTSLGHIAQGLGFVVIVAVAAASAVLAVGVAERDGQVVRHMLRVVSASGRNILLIGGIYILSLALINAVVIVLRVTDVTPFQVGAPGFILLVVSGLLLYSEIARAPHHAREASPAAQRR